jgi:tetratricopeptide (TPR) repeat protein
MASIAAAPSALQARLRELQDFGLGRPANVLFSEYVTVLVARGVIDAATSEQMSFAFYAAHYGDLNVETASYIETVARLEGVTAQLAAMPAKERLELSERVKRDLRTLSGNAARSAITKVPVAPEPAWEAPHIAAADGLWNAEPPPSNELSDEGLIRSVPVHSADSDSRRRRRRRLNLLVPTALGLFFAGYASHNLVDRSLDRHDNGISSDQATTKNSKDVRDDSPSREETLRKWAVAEARLQHDQEAKLAYEHLLAYRPKDALTLNNLAWLYLTTNDPAVHNPERGLELAMRAIREQRSAFYLDTAAEAYFQTGNPEEAVKLEKEALLQPQKFVGFQQQLVSTLSQQLQKFEAACKPRPQSASTPSRGSAPPKTPAALHPRI